MSLDYYTANPLPGFCSGCNHKPCVCPGKVIAQRSEISELHRKISDLESRVGRLELRQVTRRG